MSTGGPTTQELLKSFENVVGVVQEVLRAAKDERNPITPQQALDMISKHEVGYLQTVKVFTDIYGPDFEKLCEPCSEAIKRAREELEHICSPKEQTDA